jgi:hypothetical protein
MPQFAKLFWLRSKVCLPHFSVTPLEVDVPVMIGYLSSHVSGNGRRFLVSAGMARFGS